MGRFPSVQRGSLTPYIFSAPRSAEAICRIQNLLKVQERARDRLPTGEFGEAWTSHATRVPTNTNTPPEYPPIQIPHQSTHQYKYATRVPSNTNTPPEYPPVQIPHQSTHQCKYAMSSFDQQTLDICNKCKTFASLVVCPGHKPNRNLNLNAEP